MSTLILNIGIEFGPLAAFILAYSVSDFFTAIAVTMVTAVVSLATALIVQRRVALFPIFSTVLILIFGSLSLYFQDEGFFIFLDTLNNGLLGAGLAISLWLGRPALAPLFDHVFALTPAGWYYLTRRWAILLISIAVLNEMVRLFGTPEQWVYFKTANMALTVAFAFWQFRLSARERVPGEANALGLRIAAPPDPG
jgi:intracellular septation protein